MPVEKIAAIIKSVLAGSGDVWVSCEEKMPSEDTDVLVSADEDYVAHWDGDRWWSVGPDSEAREIDEKVTHWRPYLSPPQVTARGTNQ